MLLLKDSKGKGKQVFAMPASLFSRFLKAHGKDSLSILLLSEVARIGRESITRHLAASPLEVAACKSPE